MGHGKKNSYKSKLLKSQETTSISYQNILTCMFLQMHHLKACSWLHTSMRQVQMKVNLLVFGRKTVATKEQLSIPRLELQAAVIATRIKDNLFELHETSVIEAYMWLDHSTVLGWLSFEKKLPVFVANRVAEILDTTTVNSWRHVNGAMNPADIGTKGLIIYQILDIAWLHGPSWITSEAHWPKKLQSKDVELEESSKKFVRNLQSMNLCRLP